MDQERDDYADLDLPPPSQWVRNVLMILCGMAVAASLLILAAVCSAANGPRLD
jgi:hypothetical protein